MNQMQNDFSMTVQSPCKVRAIAVSVLVYATFLCVCGTFARTVLTSFQKTEGLLLLSGCPRKGLYEMWSITLPNAASILAALAAVSWICVKVVRSKLSMQYLYVILVYVIAFHIFQFFLVGLEFEAFD